MHVHRPVRDAEGCIQVEYHPEHHEKEFTGRDAANIYALAAGLIREKRESSRSPEEIREFLDLVNGSLLVEKDKVEVTTEL